MIVFLCPLIVMYGGFLLLTPREVLNSKPTLSGVLLGLTVATFGMTILVIVFSSIWALLMRIIFGAARVRTWIDQDNYDFGPLGSKFERLMRRICFLAL